MTSVVDPYDLLKMLEEEIKIIMSSDFEVEVTSTNQVPTTDDSGLTYPDLDNKRLKCKTVETCVLYIDIRKSTDLNISKRPKILAKLYSAFIRSMAKAAEYWYGEVRNIVGDRLMIVFPSDLCFIRSYMCAILLCDIGRKINASLKGSEFHWGIGIDYGKMLVTKAGIKKQGKENPHYKSLVWLGPTANIASKLTDAAGKEHWYFDDDFNQLMNFKAANILITESVYKGLPNYWQEDFTVQKGIYIPQYSGTIYGYDYGSER